MVDIAMKKIDKYQFSLNALIGCGSYANVYKGEDRETGRTVAIKMIDRRKISREDYLMNGLLQEIEIMKRLDSPYIVKLIDVLETKNNYYIVQEYCDLGDFRHFLNEHGALSESESKRILVDILNGFLELLKHGVIHRDLKPENILISSHPTHPNERMFKLADFGFSRTVDNFRRQMLKSLVGTPMYMSPQILMFEKYTSKSDIWSIGMIFYEMLYGTVPWEAHSQYQLVEMIKTQPIQWISAATAENKRQSNDSSPKKQQQNQQRSPQSNPSCYSSPSTNNPPQKKFLHFEQSPPHASRKSPKACDVIIGDDNDQAINRDESNNNNNSNNISETAVNFLYKCLQTTEEKRMQWDDIYAHELFAAEKSFAHVHEKHRNLEDKALYLINNMRQKIHSTDTDLLALFKHFDFTKDSKLDVKEFEFLLKRIDKEINREEIEYLFNKFDTDGDNLIDFDEFHKWLQRNNVRFSTHNNSQTERKSIIDAQLNEEVRQVLMLQTLAAQSITSTNSIPAINANESRLKPNQQQLLQQHQPQQQPQQLMNFLQYQSQGQRQPPSPMGNISAAAQKRLSLPENPIAAQQAAAATAILQGGMPAVNSHKRVLSVEENAIFAIGKLRLTIDQYAIDLKELFDRYNKSVVDALNLKEFARMIRKIDENLGEAEIAIAFRKFDVQDSGKVSFAQFEATLADISKSVVIQIKSKSHNSNTASSVPEQRHAADCESLKPTLELKHQHISTPTTTTGTSTPTSSSSSSTPR